MAGFVYLIWVQGTDRYKIGSSGYPEKRLRALQTGCPYQLELLAIMECADSEYTERMLHQQFKQYRTLGEYFAFSPLLIPNVLAEFNKITPFVASQLQETASQATLIIERFNAFKQSTAEDIVKASENGLCIGFLCSSLQRIGRDEIPNEYDVFNVMASRSCLLASDISLAIKFAFNLRNVDELVISSLVQMDIKHPESIDVAIQQIKSLLPNTCSTLEDSSESVSEKLVED
ncbi:GIY-YIG nuclease family protein [Leptothoe sp. LEGE 181152]|nr:GIY-YIG nuclease family protein [Leptothoe sp. LEGE 181152]